MVVIYRTKNGWLLNHGQISWVNFPEITTEILTFHSNEGLMNYLQSIFGLKQERDAKGRFVNNKNQDMPKRFKSAEVVERHFVMTKDGLLPIAEMGGRGKHQNPDLPHMRKG